MITTMQIQRGNVVASIIDTARQETVDLVAILFSSQWHGHGYRQSALHGPATALALIGERLPELPHWPQLPQRGSREHFCHRFLQPLVDSGLLWENAGRRYLDASPQHIAESLIRFYERKIGIAIRVDQRTNHALAQHCYS